MIDNCQLPYCSQYVLEYSDAEILRCPHWHLVIDLWSDPGKLLASCGKHMELSWIPFA